MSAIAQTNLGGRRTPPAAAAPRTEVFTAVVPSFPSDLSPATLLERQFDAVQREVDGLRGELDQLRRRDEALNFYMQRLDDELRLAARLQQDFLPKSLPQIGRLRFQTLFRPAGYVSGDLYDVMRLDERRVGFYMADAVGHGMPAALLTMFVRQALVTKDITPTGYRLLDAGEALGRLNGAMLEQNLSHANFVTAVYGVIDADTLQLTVARAGHPAPLLFRPDGGVEPVSPDGCLLGVFPDETFATATVQLRPGDRIVVFTDGIEVAFADAANGPKAAADAAPAPADPQPWREELIRRRGLPAEQLLGDFANHLDNESGSLDPRDDLTMMVIDVER